MPSEESFHNIENMPDLIDESQTGAPLNNGSRQNAAISGARRQKTALYREWRPRTFNEVVEQEHVVKTLRNSILRNRLAHAYLFCGTRGTGKTTLAQILSRAVNCLNPIDAEPCNECAICTGILSGRLLDVVEIDAASNNSVDNIRNLRDAINYTPAEAKYKVYIIDEVHMLSGGAFNALLKTLEEPPAYVLFILATTEPHKLPATILSRCQRFDFRRITDAAIVGRLELIANYMGAAVDRDALGLIAKLSDGALRDAISIYDQCAAAQRGASLALDDVLRVTGRPGDDNLIECARILISRDIKSVPVHVAALSAAGMNLIQFIDGMTVFFRHLLMIRLGQERGMFPEMSEAVYREAEGLAKICDTDYLLAVASEFSTMAYNLKNSSNQTILLEVALAKICLGRFHSDGSIEGINARISALEQRLDELTAANVSEPVIRPVEQVPERVSRQDNLLPERNIQPDDPAQERDSRPVEHDQATASPPIQSTHEPVSLPDEQIVRPNASPASGQEIEYHTFPDKAATNEDETGQAVPEQAVPEQAVSEQAVSEQATSSFDNVRWKAIIEKFKTAGNPLAYTVLEATTAYIIDDNFRIVLPANMANLSSYITNPDNILKLRSEIQIATGRVYTVQIISENDKFRDIAKYMTDKYNIPTKIHP